MYYRGHNMSTFQLLRRQIWRWRRKCRWSLSSLLHTLELYHRATFFVDLKYITIIQLLYKNSNKIIEYTMRLIEIKIAETQKYLLRKAVAFAMFWQDWLKIPYPGNLHRNDASILCECWTISRGVRDFPEIPKDPYCWPVYSEIATCRKAYVLYAMYFSIGNYFCKE